MANIWPVYEGERPTVGGPWAHLPLSEAIEICELRPSDFLSDLGNTPRFGPAGRDLTFAGFKHVVVEVEPDEAKRAKWEPGFYKSKIKPDDLFGRLIGQALIAKLGRNNVVRVVWQPTTDSQGEDAIGVTVVLKPGAVRRLQGETLIEALVSLRTRLRELRDDRVPIVHYATEAELAQDARS
jgi:hypothetical protein